MKIRTFAFTAGFLAISLAGWSQEQDTIKRYDLNEVVISAFRTRSNFRDLPHSVQVLHKKDIESIPVRDLGDLLKKTAGIDVIEYQGLQSNIGMRGFTPTANGYTLVLINGLPAGTQNVSTIDLQSAEQVEILKGPFSAFFGSGAMAGIINIVTPVSRGQLTGSAGMTFGSFGTWQARARAGGSLGGRLNFDFHAKAFTQSQDFTTGKNNILRMSDLESEVMDSLSYGQVFGNTSYRKYNTGFRIGWDISKNWQAHWREDLFLAKDVLMHGTFWGIYGQQQKDLQRLSHSLMVTGKQGSHSIRFSPYLISDRETYYSDLSDDRFTTNINLTNTYGFILQDEIVLGNHTLLFGTDNKSGRYESSLWSGRSDPGAPYQPDNSSSGTGVFMQYRANLLSNKLNFSAGVRYDLLTFRILDTEHMDLVKASDVYNTLNPNIGIQYSILPGLRIHTSAGTAFLSPDAFKKTGSYTLSSAWGTKVYRGNPELRPESSTSVDFGLSLGKREQGWSADLTWFGSTHRDMIVSDYSNWDTTSFMNTDHARMNGIEGNLAFDFGVFSDYRYSAILYARFSHLLRAEVKVDSTYGDMRYVRGTNASFGMEFRNFKGFTARLNARYIGHRFEDNWLYDYNYTTWEKVPYLTTGGLPIRPGLIDEAILEHPDFLVMDFSFSYTFRKWIRVGLEIQNLGNENYTEKDAYYMPGRMILGQVTFEF